MIGMSLFDIIKFADQHSEEAVHKALRARIKACPNEIYLVNAVDHSSVCHAAANLGRFDILELLAFETDARLEELTTDGLKPRELLWQPASRRHYDELVKEQKRRQLSQNQHLHDLLRVFKNEPDKLQIKMVSRISSHPHEINEQTYLGKTALHLAAEYHLPIIIWELLLQNNGNLATTDVYDRSPFDLVKNTEVIDKYQDQYMKHILGIYDSIFKHEEIVKGKERILSLFSRRREELFTRTKEKLSKKQRRITLHFGQNLPSQRNTIALTERKHNTFRNNEVAIESTDSIDEDDSNVKLPPLSEEKKNKYRTKIDLAKLETLTHYLSAIQGELILPRKNDSNDELNEALNLEQLDEFQFVDFIVQNPRLLLGAIWSDDAQFMSRYLNADGSPDEILPNGNPLFIEALTHQSEQVAWLLLENGAMIRCNNECGNKIQDLLRHDKSNTEFLRKLQRKIVEKAEAIGDLSAIEKKLLQNEYDFHIALIKRGLRPNLREAVYLTATVQNMLIDEDLDINQDLILFLQQICSGHVEEREKKVFDPDYLRIVTIGILTEYKPAQIVTALSMLYPRLALEQKLIAIFLIKEIILWDSFHKSYNENYFIKEVLSNFFELMKNDEFDEIIEYLKVFISEKRKQTHPVNETHTHIDFILSTTNAVDGLDSFRRIDDILLWNDDETQQFAMKIAGDLEAVTLQFYQLVQPREFLHNCWQKKNKEVMSPNIVYQTELFNRTVNFFVLEILNIKDKLAQRVKVIELLMRVQTILLNQPVPNYNAALIINCVFTKAPVYRLKETFFKVDRRLLEQWSKEDKFLSPAQNYKNLREAMKVKSQHVPIVAVFLKDITFVQENAKLSNRVYQMGKVTYAMLKRINQLRTLPANQFQTDLYLSLNFPTQLDENVLRQLSLSIEPLMLTLSPGSSLEGIKMRLQEILNDGGPLIIKEGEKVEQDLFALYTLDQWLRTNTESVEDRYQAWSIYLLANQVVTTKAEAAYKLIYEHSSSPRQMTPRFNDTKKRASGFIPHPKSEKAPEKTPKKNKEARFST